MMLTKSNVKKIKINFIQNIKLYPAIDNSTSKNCRIGIVRSPENWSS